MLESIFVKLLEISIQASFFILAVMLIRIFFKRLPKQFICILWGMVAVRLVFPFEITSAFSLVPDTSRVQTLADMVYTPQEGILVLDKCDSYEVNHAVTPVPAINTIFTENNGAKINVETISITGLFTNLWIAGMILLFTHGAVSYFLTKYKLRESVHSKANIWYSDTIPAPFVIGYIRPQIYIPFSVNQADLPYIIAHEKAHITHFDHLGKLMGYILLGIYWFNPFIWIGYLFYCIDLELACDERVLQKLGTSEKKPYSQALLTCSVSNKTLLQSPLAFGEVAIKERIMNILKYKKPEFWGILVSCILCLVLALCFLTSKEPAVDSTNVNTSGTTENFNGFLLSQKEENGQALYEYRYYDEQEDVTIRMNLSGTQAYVIHAGKELLIETHGLFHDSGELGASTLPYLADVTSDGQKELIIQFTGMNAASSPNMLSNCYVYRLDTMEEVFFNTDATELAKLLTFTPLSFKAETNELTVQVKFDEKIHPNLIESDRTPWEITAVISPEKVTYWKEAHNAYIENKYASLYYNENKPGFTASFTVYLDDTCTYNRFYPFVIQYLWDEAAEEFIIDLETAGVQIAG